MKKVKVLSILLCLVMVLSVLTILPNVISAKVIDIADEGGSVDLAVTGGMALDQLKAKFPDGAYWNHVVTDWSNNGDELKARWDDSFADSYTWTPCATHNGTASVGQVDCNACYGAIQCKGFANKLSYDAFGSHCVDWGTVSAWNCKSGDVIHYYASDTDPEWGHWAMVIGRSGSTVYFGEANRGGNCKISWGRAMNIGSFSSSTCYSAPYELPPSSGNLPEGWLDSVVVDNNEITVKGWAYDKDCPNRPIDVHIYVGDGCHITTANLDLDPGVTSYTGYSNHCFQTTFTTNKSGSQEVKAYGINVDKNGTPVGTGNAQLNQSFTVNITQITGSNLGDDFYANIITGKNGLAVGADSDDNVRVQTRDGRDNQIWHFQRNSDGTYCITNVGQNKYLDNTGGAWGHPDGIKLFSSSDIDAQRWYVQLTNSGYSFIPKSSKTSAATVSGASFSEGTYIIDRQYNESIAQIFTIDYVGLKPAVTSTYNGHTYELYDITCSWHQAYRTCEQLGGHLVTIASKGENDFVWSLKYSGTKKSDYLWLGATDEINEGTWQWITGESFTYHPWASTQPDNAGSAEHYLEMNADSSWNDLTKYYNPHHPVFICEYDNTSINASAYTPSKTTTYNNKTYEYYNTEVMWSTAKAICEAKGGHLVIINDTSENKAVNDLAKNRVWLGFSDIGTEGRFIDVLGNELTYSNWLSGEPNNYYMCENYAEMYADGTWNDARYAKRGFVCEYELPNYLGDVDGDGSITITDATTIQRYIAEYELPNPDIIQKCGDVDGDGSITVTDATTIQKYIAEYELPYPIGEPVA